MENGIILAKVNAALLTVLIVSAPVLIATVTVGVVVGLLQALTQIQDQALPQAVKIAVVLVILLTLGPLLGRQIASEASMVLDEFPAATR
jgi:type III secretion protein S